MAIYPVADLHCDLLSYIAGKTGRDCFNLESRCSLPQLQAGGVVLQTLAIFTPTKLGSASFAAKQHLQFQELTKHGFFHLKKREIPFEDKVHIAFALESASALCEEDEDIDMAFSRFDHYLGDPCPLLYLSLTHNTENRFGGGNATSKGLTDDGRALLTYMSGKGVAIDFSHTSDQLAEDIFNHIDKNNLDLRPIASHSNFRSVANVKRNLLDEHALEIARRGGVIGFTVFKPFLGQGILRQLEHAKTLGLLDHLCLGADFFYDRDVIPGMKYLHPLFYEELGDSSCYPRLFKVFSEVLTGDEIENIAHKNLNRWFQG